MQCCLTPSISAAEACSLSALDARTRGGSPAAGSPCRRGSPLLCVPLVFLGNGARLAARLLSAVPTRFAFRTDGVHAHTQGIPPWIPQWLLKRILPANARFSPSTGTFGPDCRLGRLGRVVQDEVPQARGFGDRGIGDLARLLAHLRGGGGA